MNWWTTLWLVMVPVGIVCATVVFGRWFRHADRAMRGRCLRCGHDMAGSVMCTECGSAALMRRRIPWIGLAAMLATVPGVVTIVRGNAPRAMPLQILLAFAESTGDPLGKEILRREDARSVDWLRSHLSVSTRDEALVALRTINAAEGLLPKDTPILLDALAYSTLSLQREDVLMVTSEAAREWFRATMPDESVRSTVMLEAFYRLLASGIDESVWAEVDSDDLIPRWLIEKSKLEGGHGFVMTCTIGTCLISSDEFGALACSAAAAEQTGSRGFNRLLELVAMYSGCSRCAEQVMGRAARAREVRTRFAAASSLGQFADCDWARELVEELARDSDPEVAQLALRRLEH